MMTALIFSLAANIAVFGADQALPGRIAITADGDSADPDDWAATPMELALLAKSGLMDRLVHLDYNNKYGCIYSTDSSRTEHTYAYYMKASVLGAAEVFGCESNLFFDGRVESERHSAKNNLTAEVLKATRDDPLYIVVNGAYNLLYEVFEPLASDRSLYHVIDHVFLIQHSTNNENATSCGNGKNLSDLREIIDGNYELKTIKIPGQGKTLNNHHITPDEAGFEWLKSSPCLAYNYVYDQIYEVWDETDLRDAPKRLSKSDISDSGMMMYLVKRLTTSEDRAVLQNTQWVVSDFEAILGSSFKGCKTRNGE